MPGDLRRSIRSKIHPHTGDRLRSALAQITFRGLILYFVAGVLIGGLVLGSGFWITRAGGEPVSLLHWWRVGSMTLTTFPIDGTFASVDPSVGRLFVEAVASIAGVVFPALFFGAIVFKFFVAPELFVFRRQISVQQNPSDHDLLPADGFNLAIRLYSSTDLQLLDVNCSLMLCLERPTAGAGVVYRYRRVTPLNPHWPVADTHLPHTLRVQLENSDVQTADGALKLVAVQGHTLRADDQLYILLSGATPELGTEFTERHCFDVLKFH